MIRLKVGRQAERVGIDRTLSAVIAEGIVLEEARNQHPCHVGKEYADYKGNPLINLFVNHVMNHLTFVTEIGDIWKGLAYSLPLLFYYVACQSTKRRTHFRMLGYHSVS